MELIAQYIEVRRRRNDPWLTKFLGEKPMPEYQRKMAESMTQRGGGVGVNLSAIRMGRQSGKTGAHMAYLDQLLSGHMHNEPRRPQLRISDEIIQDGQWDVVSEIARSAGQRMVQAMEQRFYESIMGATPARPPAAIEFENGSRIQALDSINAIRGRLARDSVPEPVPITSFQQAIETFGEPRGVPLDFRREYLGTFVGGDRDGDYGQ